MYSLKLFRQYVWYAYYFCRPTIMVSIPIKTKIESHKGLKVSPFKKDIRVTVPHKHNNYFEILYLSAGSGFHYIDSKQYPIEPPVIFFVRKEQVHHWNFKTEPEGYVALIKKSFVDESLDNDLKTLLSKLSHHSVVFPAEPQVINTIFELLYSESSAAREHSRIALEGLLKALLAIIAANVQPYWSNAVVKADTYNAFRDLLSRNDKLINSVAHYAALLNTTPQNLNAICRKAAQQSAAEIIGEYIISEAKRLLLYTESTITEVSHVLQFHDVSHFIKYFKRYTGLTPQAFRLLP